jgi:NIMA (never in mitosis gene a)-related kinase 2
MLKTNPKILVSLTTRMAEGLWEGFFVDGASKRPLKVQLEFEPNGRLTGALVDDVSSHRLVGHYADESLRFVAIAADGQRRIFEAQKTTPDDIDGSIHCGGGGSAPPLRQTFSLRFNPPALAPPISFDADRLRRYDVLERLSTGSFAVVSKVRRRSDGRILVLKDAPFGRMKPHERRMAVNEITVLLSFTHPHIIGLHDVVIDRDASRLILFIDFCQRGDLATLIARYRSRSARIDESFIWRVIHQIASALKILHNPPPPEDNSSPPPPPPFRVIHRDLKPANVLLDAQLNVRLGDYGLSAIVPPNDLAHSRVGTPLYMAPEQIATGTRGVARNDGYGDGVDIWALGCVISLLFCTSVVRLTPPLPADASRTKWLR